MATTTISLGNESANSNNPDCDDDVKEATRQLLVVFHAPRKIGQSRKTNALSSVH